jgi:hypothetical protein
MRRSSPLFILVTAAITCCGLVVGAGAAIGATHGSASSHARAAATTIGSWGTAEQAPGTASLNVDNSAATTVVSCTTTDCTAGGTYIDVNQNTQAFVTVETDGTWSTAETLPNFTTLNFYRSAFTSLSCPSPGNCVAGGDYTDSSESNEQAWIATETDGSWAAAEEAPGTGTLNTGGSAEVTSISCGSAGNCVAAGYYTATGLQQVFEVEETDGTWGTAVEIPGVAGLNADNYATVVSVSCASAGNCTIGGTYRDSSGATQAFIIDETDSVWGTAEEAPGTSGLNSGDGATITSVSCASAGNCTVGGFYKASKGNEAFVLTETNGTWGTAEAAPGTSGLNTGDGASVNSVSCASAGNCTVGGYYTTSSPAGTEAFVLTETNGTWGTAEEAPGTSGLNTKPSGQVTSVSCASAGNCTVGGEYNTPTAEDPFVLTQTNGTWGTAEEAPGSGSLNTGNSATVDSVSCSSAGNCALGGQYAQASNSSQQAFVDQTATTTAATPTTTAVSLSPATVGYGDEQAAKVTAKVTATSGTATGTVTVKSGTTTVCTVTLASGSGSCSPSATGLAAGTQHLTGTYNGASGFGGSTSAAETLTVVRATTKTSFSSSAGSVTYGHENTLHLSASVSPQYSGTVGGTVSVILGKSTVCTMTLSGGKGSCTPGSTTMGTGTQHLVAVYNTSTDFDSSSSAAKTVTVGKASSKTALKLSAGTITYGKEQSEHLSVTASPQYSGTPTGKVVIKKGSSTVCTITLKSGKGSCTLSSKQFGKGTYTLTASYQGSGDYNGSTSGKATLKVVK